MAVDISAEIVIDKPRNEVAPLLSMMVKRNVSQDLTRLKELLESEKY